MDSGTPASHPPTHPSGSTTTTSTVNVGVGERRQNRPSCGVDTLYSSPIDMPSLFPWVELQKERALPSWVDFCSHSCGRGQASRRKSCKSGPGSLWGKVASVLFSWCAEGQVPLGILCPAAQRWRKFVWRPRDPKLIMTVHLVSATVAILACQPVWLWLLCRFGDPFGVGALHGSWSVRQNLDGCLALTTGLVCSVPRCASVLHVLEDGEKGSFVVFWCQCFVLLP